MSWDSINPFKGLGPTVAALQSTVASLQTSAGGGSTTTGIIPVSTLDTSVANTLDTRGLGTYYFCSGGNAAITLPGSNVPIGGFFVLKNLTTADLTYTNLSNTLTSNASHVLIYISGTGWTVM